LKAVAGIDRSKGLILLTIVVAATILGGVALTTGGADTSGKTTEVTSVAADAENTVELTSVSVGSDESTVELLTVEDETEEINVDSGGFMLGGMMLGPAGPGPRGGPHRGRGFVFIEVSEEFEESILAIAEGDEDVQALLDEGYNVTGVRPIIKTVVDGNGDVVTKATDAIVLLEKEDTGRAGVWVNLDEAKVTEIVIVTRTVIEKP
jgi:hypothetical protein